MLKFPALRARWVREQAQLEAYQQLAVRISQADQFARMIAPENHRPEVPRLVLLSVSFTVKR